MTLLLSRADVERLLTPAICIDAVEEAFRELALGKVPPPAILGVHGEEGSFHVKAGLLGPYFAAKINANFPRNGPRHGLPTIQGAVILFDSAKGVPLAIMDSISITALRTAAGSAVAAKYLAPKECHTALICGCGGQAAAQLQALMAVRHPRRVLVYDQDSRKAAAFAASVRATATPDLAAAVAVADNENKQEIEPALMAAATVVTDLTAQAATIGDLHHAIEAGSMSRDDVHAELADVVAGRSRGRSDDAEITLFDSTGTGLQDVAAAIAAYKRAVDRKEGHEFHIGS